LVKIKPYFVFVLTMVVRTNYKMSSPVT